MKQAIILLTLLLITHFCYAQQSGSDHSDASKLDSLVQAQMSEKSIPGMAIGIVKDGRIVLAKGYGYSNVENKVSATEHTLYQLGSVTKMITGHLLAMLVNKGEISLSDTLAHYFPPGIKFPKSPSGQVVSIREMATHSAEFPRYPANLQREDPEPIRGYSKEEMLEGIEMHSIDTLTGLRYNYSNFGYGVLGVAMENRMNKSLGALMKEYIFDPYDMPASSLSLNEDIRKKLAVPYLEVEPLESTEPWDMGTLSGAGNVFSSVADMNKFMIMLLKDNPVNKIQQKPYFQINESWSYGLGCFIIDSEKRKTEIIYHGGDIDGYASSLSLYPEYKLGFVILTNWGEGQVVGEAFTEISAEIVKQYLGEISE